MRTVTVYMSDGDTITTSINGTDQEIIRHYLGNRFEAGSDTKHHVALLVHFHDTNRKHGLRIRNIENGCVRVIKGVRLEVGECVWLEVSDTEYALDDVWVYDLNGEWIKGIGYKHATTETRYVAHNSEHGYLMLDNDFGWRYTQDKTKATTNTKSCWDDIARQLTHRFKLVAI